MNIIILIVHINWVYRLYEEYILSIKKFININYNYININIIYYDIDNFNIEEINLLNYDKIFYSGDLEILKIIINNINYNYKKLYFINIEQMSHPEYYKMMRNVDININIIDYSEENLPYFKNIYNNIYLLPPFFEIKNNILNKDIDILSIINNTYRKSIIDKIDLNKNLNTLFIDNCFNNERDYYFLKSKIYINIHCSEDHQTMELIRIINLIMNKVIIITEKSINSQLLFIKDHIIICNDISDFKHYTNEILNNYDYYFNKFYGDFKGIEYNDYIKKNFDKLFAQLSH
jgi:hypothetical protein